MAYLAPIHQASSVRHALKLSFLSPDEECLVVAKANRLEFYAQTPDGLTLKHSKAVYGKVTMLAKLRPESATADHLFVGTDRFMYFTLSWDARAKQLKTEKSFVDQAEKSARDSQTGDRCHIDPTGSYLTLELYEGVITVIPFVKKSKKDTTLEIGSLANPITARIPELFIRASAFIERRTQEKNEKPKLALLYEDNYKRVKLKIRQVSYSPGLSGDGPNVELEDVEGFNEDLEIGSSHVIPVPAPAYGLVVLGETSITYYENSSQQFLQRPLKEATIFVAWEQIDQQRFILADEYGKLYLLMLEIDQRQNVTGWKLDVLGETSKASILVYLGEGQVFVGSHQGDSQVISIRPQAIDVIQTLPNIAPILDFSVMDMGKGTGEGQSNEFSSGQARLVTGSGAFKDGSLRSVRSGVGLEDLGLLDRMENVTNMFSIPSNPSVDFVDTLVVSFIDETRVFHFSVDGDVEEVDSFKGLQLDTGTLYAGSTQGQNVVQVTSEGIRLLDIESDMNNAEWHGDGGQKITSVTANQETIVVAIDGSKLVALDLTRDLKVITSKQFGPEEQIACVNIPATSSNHIIVGFWGSSTISVLHLKSFETAHRAQISDEGVSVPRSLLVTNLLPSQDPSLFVAMADGNVITMSMDPKTGALSNRKSIVLGTQPADFKALPRDDGLYNVFATCENPSLIYGSEGRLVYAAVTAENATSVCAFNAECYPGAIAIATREELKIAHVDEERSTHVQGLPVGETVRRIAYSSELRAFGLGTIKRTLVDGVEIVQSHFKLADEIALNVFASYELNEDELIESVMRAQLDNGSGGLAERFVVGTAYVDDEQGDSIRGRILVLETTEDRALKLVTEHNVKGACRCLAMVDGSIVAALIKTVVIYSFDYQTASSPHLQKVASYRTSTAPIDLSVSKSSDGSNLIAIADLMKSVSIVKYEKGSGGLKDTLNEIARHFQTTWATAVALVDENLYLESDAEGNLLVLHQDVKGVTAEDRRRLRPTSEICLGEVVNRIRTINVPVMPDAAVSPRAFLATVEGSIYLFALIADTRRDLLMNLQSSMAKFVQSPGHVPFGIYRGFRNQVREESEPFRFVDGELIESFLDVSEDLQEKIVAEARVKEGIEEIRGIVEGLRRLR